MTTYIELQYLPPLWTFAALACSGDILYIEAQEHYHKGSFRNRAHIAGPNGIHRLSIPLRQGKNQQMPTSDVLLATDTPWPRTHWRTLASAYGSAPFFDHYADSLASLFEKPHTHLWGWNTQFVHWILAALALPGTILYSVEYQARLPEHIADWRDVLRPQKGPKLPAGIRPVKYGQVFEDRHGFLPGLSVLDLIFCTGPAAVGILRAMRGYDPSAP
jgi:hypothetical protein